MTLEGMEVRTRTGDRTGDTGAQTEGLDTDLGREREWDKRIGRGGGCVVGHATVSPVPSCTAPAPLSSPVPAPVHSPVLLTLSVLLSPLYAPVLLLPLLCFSALDLRKYA